MSTNGSNKKESAKTTNHVFLFRHCVRSTDSNVYLFNNTLDPTLNNASIPITNFWSQWTQSEVILPKWNVPKNWCTEVGMKQMVQTGSYIYNSLLLQNPGRTFKFRFISDTSQRDVDTTLSLQEGISAAILADTVNRDLYKDSDSQTISLVSTNVHATELLPNLYQPFLATTMSSVPMCTLQVTLEQMREEVQYRYDTIVPKPPSTIYNTLKVLQVNEYKMMNTDAINNNDTTITTDAWGRPQLSGWINVLKLVAQIIFYSRASGIRPRQFLFRITTQQLYQRLLPYIYYTRSILNVGTTESATRGAILTRTMMDAIQLPQLPAATDDDDENEPFDMVTILVGHDTDLDAVATAMNVAWEFDVPYSSDTTTVNPINDSTNSSSNSTNSQLLAWYMTPPGSAIYLKSHYNTDVIDVNTMNIVVSMSYVHPIYNVDANDGSIISYDMVPLQLLNFTNRSSSSSTASNTSYSVNGNSTTVAYTELQYHINQTLRQYVGATDCYYNPAPVSGLQQDGSTEKEEEVVAVETVTQPPVSAPSKNSSSVNNINSGPVGYIPTPSGYIPTPSPMDDSTGNSNTSSIIEPSSQQQQQLSWGSGFGSGVAASMALMIVVYWFYHQYCRQRRGLRSPSYNGQSSMNSSLQLNEYSDVVDADTDDATVNTRNTSKRNIDLI